MNYEGDISELSLPDEPSSLVGAGAGAPRGGARNKDRMSYRHLAYQIDLTQVATTEVCQFVVHFLFRLHVSEPCLFALLFHSFVSEILYSSLEAQNCITIFLLDLTTFVLLFFP